MIPYCILAIEDDDDREFMAFLFQEYQRLMYRTIHQITHDPWSTEDVMQETLIKLIDKIPLLRSQDRSRRVNYIISAAKNTAINYLKREKKATVFSFVDDMDSLAELSSDPIEDYLEQVSIRDDWDCLHRVWPELDSKSQYLLEGRYILKKAPEEMAHDLGIKTNSLRMAITRAKRQAKKLIQEEMEVEK